VLRLSRGAFSSHSIRCVIGCSLGCNPHILLVLLDHLPQLVVEILTELLHAGLPEVGDILPAEVLCSWAAGVSRLWCIRGVGASCCNCVRDAACPRSGAGIPLLVGRAILYITLEGFWWILSRSSAQQTRCCCSFHRGREPVPPTTNTALLLASFHSYSCECNCLPNVAVYRATLSIC
jgi:hypothetical protein